MTRIIGGVWKRTPLNIIDVQDLRPTPDRVKETLFNWLGDVTNWHALDLFAGSGNLGLELLSRAGEHSTVISYENNKLAVKNLHLIQKKLNISPQQWSIKTGSVFDLINASSVSHQLDIIFCDPPFAWLNSINNQYELKLWNLLEQLLSKNNTRYLYCELPSKNPKLSLCLETITCIAPNYHLHRQLTAGEVCATLWERF
jgi:16S rRNA (guanine(966)-N(2))-methyltransferase RsmD